MNPSETIRLHIIDTIDETADTRSFMFSAPDDESQGLPYQPGQFLTLKVPCGDEPLWRSYSFSSSPLLNEPPRVTVKRVPGGRASNWLLDNLKSGMTIEALPAAGNFVPPSLDGDFLLLAAGSGITPVFSILNSILEGGAGNCRLIYMCRDHQSFIFGNQLEKLLQRYSERFQLNCWFDHQQGLPTQQNIKELAKTWQDAQCYLCGPAAFMSLARDALIELGVPEQRLHMEHFEEPVPAIQLGRAQPTPDDVPLHVSLKGEEYDLHTYPGELLLDAMLRQGLKPPSGCRGGNCGVCRCKLTHGKTRMRNNQALMPSEVREGWILACQAEPVDQEELHVEFESIFG